MKSLQINIVPPNGKTVGTEHDRIVIGYQNNGAALARNKPTLNGPKSWEFSTTRYHLESGEIDSNDWNQFILKMIMSANGFTTAEELKAYLEDPPAYYPFIKS